MAIARHYIMQAAAGEADTLAAALLALADNVRGLPGALGVELLRDRADATRFIFIEAWESVEAHRDSGAHLSKSVLARVQAALGGPPVIANLDCLSRA